MASERNLRGPMVLIVALLMLGGTAFSQEAAPDPIAGMPNKQLTVSGSLTKQDINDLRQAVSSIKLKEVTLAEKQKEFNDYFNELIFPAWLAPDKVANFAKERIDFKGKMLYGLREVPDAHEALNRLTLKTMGDIAGGPDFNPIARYNAMILIGELDETEPQGRVPGVPFKEAMTKGLMQALITDSKDVPDYVKVAALQGILRHAQAGVIENRADVLKAVLPIATAAKAPVGRSADGHAWMRRRAVQIIGALALSTGTVPVELQKIVKDTSAPLSLRCAAAQALGELDYAATPIVKPAELAKDVGVLGLEATRRELKETELSQPRLKSHLHAVKVGLGGPDDVNQPGKGIPGGNADAALKVIGEMMAALDAKSTDAASISKQADALAAALGVPAGPAPAAPKPAAKAPAKAGGLDEFGVPAK